PAPAGQPVRWIRKDELDRFDPLFEQAVQRGLARGKSAIFLSGGLDSISVAAVAADVCRREGQTVPHALSLGFPDPSCDEEHVQRSVARALSLPLEFASFKEALGDRPLLELALDESRQRSAPLQNIWYPAYAHLGALARRYGCRTILTGNGGDE